MWALFALKHILLCVSLLRTPWNISVYKYVQNIFVLKKEHPITVQKFNCMFLKYLVFLPFGVIGIASSCFDQNVVSISREINGALNTGQHYAANFSWINYEHGYL